MVKNLQGYSKKREYKNHLYLKDLSDISKTIYGIGEKFKLQVASGWNLGRGQNPINNIKAFYFIYLTGSRIGEILREPYPKLYKDSLYITKESKRIEIQVIKVTKQNEKHWKNKKDGIRETIEQNIPLSNTNYEMESERKMWDFITSDGNSMDLTQLFESLGGYGKRTNISHFMERHFKTTLTDGTNEYTNEGLRPHILRHLRVFSFLYDHQYDKDLVQKWLGWNNDEMFDEYVYIQKQLGTDIQRKLLKKHFGDESEDMVNAPSKLDYKLGDHAKNIEKFYG